MSMRGTTGLSKIDQPRKIFGGCHIVAFGGFGVKMIGGFAQTQHYTCIQVSNYISTFNNNNNNN